MFELSKFSFFPKFIYLARRIKLIKCDSKDLKGYNRFLFQINAFELYIHNRVPKK